MIRSWDGRVGKQADKRHFGYRVIPWHPQGIGPRIPMDGRIRWCSSPWYKIAQYSWPSAFAGLMLCIHRLPIHRFRILRLLYPQFLPSSGLFCQAWNIQKLEGCLDFESEAVSGHPILPVVLTTTPFFSWYFLFLKEHYFSTVQCR